MNYIDTLRESLNIEPLIPIGGGTFITHHMVFDCETVDRFLEQISTSYRGLHWSVAIMTISNRAIAGVSIFATHHLQQTNALNFPYIKNLDKTAKGGEMVSFARFAEDFWRCNSKRGISCATH